MFNIYDFKTLTSDNGPEFAQHKQIAEITGARLIPMLHGKEGLMNIPTASSDGFIQEEPTSIWSVMRISLSWSISSIPEDEHHADIGHQTLYS
jgi:hypothetical protein